MKELGSKELLEELKELQAESNVDLGAVDPKIRAGIEGRMNEARDKLPEVKKQYYKAVASNSVLIGVHGDSNKINEFSKIAVEKFGTLSVNFKQTQAKVLEDIKSRAAGTDGFQSTEYYILISKVRDLANEIGAIGINVPELDSSLFGGELSSTVDKIVSEYYGTELDSALSFIEIGKEAFKVSFDGKRVPVVLTNCSEINPTFLPSLLDSIELTSETEVTEDLVGKVLTKVKNKISKNKKN